MENILLHICCAPCTTYVYQWFSENGFSVKGFFYNPNIQPQEEYERRLLTLEYYATAVKLKVIYAANDVKIKPKNCESCYCVRLEKTAAFAKENGFSSFSTTLLISPYQKHDLLKKMGIEIGEAFGIEFFYRDFRENFQESQKIAKAFKLYRQKYCGCALNHA